MIKNELIKFFTPLKAIVYLGFLAIFTIIPSVLFQDNIITDPYDFICGNMNDELILVIPIMLATVVSDVFTYDYELGCMKFFMIYKKREKVFVSKLVALIIISAILIIASFMILSIVYIIQNPQMVSDLCNQVPSISKKMLLFILAVMPIIFIYCSISIICKNSMIISLLIFLLVMMSDLFVKYIADITPTRFFRVFLTKGTAIDNTSIILFISYLAIFLLLNLKIFSKKEMLH